MLVDSGADFSVISNQSGVDLGFNLADAEQTLLAYGIGWTVEYVLRKVQVSPKNCNRHLQIYDNKVLS